MEKSTSLPFCVEHTGDFHGVKIPGWIRFFDVRIPDEKMFTPETKYKGRNPLSSERAEIVCGLYEPGEFHESSWPISCQAYRDFRTCPEGVVIGAAEDMIREAVRIRKVYQDTPVQESNGRGGSVNYLPVLVYLANYGWGVVADRRVYRVAYFD